MMITARPAPPAACSAPRAAARRRCRRAYIRVRVDFPARLAVGATPGRGTITLVCIGLSSQSLSCSPSFCSPPSTSPPVCLS